jgi:hypothetical protein
MRYRLGFSILLLGASALHASQFNFSYSGGTVNALGTLTATNMGGGVYQVTNISGTRDGTAIAESPIGNLGVLYTGTGGKLGLENGGAMEFAVGSSELDTVEYLNGVYQETLVNDSSIVPKITTTTLSSFTVSAVAVPEPSTLLILLTLGVAVWALGRKLPVRTVRKP